MAFEPAVIFGSVGIEIVQNDVNFLFAAIAINDAIHKIQELPASPALWKCTFSASSSLTRSTNPFTLRSSRSSFQPTRVSASRKWDSASVSPGRSTCVPLSLSVGPPLRVKALESLLVEKGLVDPAALDALIDTYEHKIGPRNSARVPS
jgi:hypothetical protein